MPPDCPHRPPCPGCPRFGEPGIAPAPLEQLGELAARHGLPAPRVHPSSALGHRHRARLAVRGRASDPQIGLFEQGSHRVVPIPDCGVHHPRINEPARLLGEVIRETGIPPYRDADHSGVLRYVQIAVERASERVQIVLVGRDESAASLGELPSHLARRLGDRLQGLFFNAQPQRTNAILGEATTRLAGEPALHESIAGVDVFFPPDAFGQNHLPLFEQAVARIHALVPERADVAELYCGVGAIGLGLLARGARVAFNERGRGGLAGLAQGLAARPAHERARARIAPGPAAENLDLLTATGTGAVVVDPPRRGLDRAVVDALAATAPPRLVYLSCDPTSLARDVDALVASGRSRLAGLEAFEFFPFTQHVETLAWLDAVDTHAPRVDSRTD